MLGIAAHHFSTEGEREIEIGSRAMSKMKIARPSIVHLCTKDAGNEVEVERESNHGEMALESDSNE